ncbi:MAG: hypothetical protein AAF599_03195 [Bacteroidota bacterium]
MSSSSSTAYNSIHLRSPFRAMSVSTAPIQTSTDITLPDKHMKASLSSPTVSHFQNQARSKRKLEIPDPKNGSSEVRSTTALKINPSRLCC